MSNRASAPPRLPLRALLPLTTAAFVTVLTEALPAGVLPAMSGGLGVGESATGQLVTIYAVGTAVSAIPLVTATAAWPRKRLLLTSMLGFAVANTITAVSADYLVTLAARFVAGIAAGVVWALLAGYARRLVPAHQAGRAVAIVMAGLPVALSLGIPAGTFLGHLVGWRATFWVVTALAAVLVAAIVAFVPDQPGAPAGRLVPRAALRRPGVPAVLFTTLVFVLAQTVFYTYVATYLGQVGLGDSVDVVLLVYGIASIVGIWYVGAHIDRKLRALTVAGTVLVAVAAAALAVLNDSHVLVYAAVTLWGLGWGGIPTLLQTAVADAAGDEADSAQAMLVTLWNVAMAAGGAIGGLLLDAAGPMTFPWTMLVLLVPVLAVVLTSRGFPKPVR
ncbi:MFS transporter [Actinosynnema sp. NPDC047251]|uniref:Permease, MFS-type n=1 Tax=Saccharothrix espanaensis (strain ATCC 51144 / DSM 44229 / JCM 9112 / NBRC 15066 / NRRL 15764) TaxID=1179773 RepID=K0JZI3_SACES|nr:MFS transporter [Saccharothrix espanaensis]CCH30059.1 Permease, MFS-type [Saccharothrix espanaensis DSM 44229]